MIPRVRLGVLLLVVLGGALTASAACSLALDTSATQCKTDADCTAKGADFAGTKCSSEGICVSKDTHDGGTGGGDAGGPDTVVEISAGHFHTCSRFLSGKVACWGKNSEGQIGDGENPQAEPTATEPSFVKAASGGALLTGATALSCGEADNCVLKDDQTVWCWGANDEGQLGNGSKETVYGAVQVTGLSKGKAPAAGDGFDCALLESGNVVCWGTNSEGQLGDGKDAVTEPGSPLPVHVSGITNAIQVSLGESHACAVLADGRIMCWGHNDFGQLGMGDVDGGQPPSSNVPVPVAGVTGAKYVELGEKHSCAIVGKEMRCWGSNDQGQLGDDGASGAMSATPVKVVGLDNPEVISAAGSHTCARQEDGEVLCWGSNAAGEIGQDPSTVKMSAKPVVVAGVDGAASVSVGNEHSCARMATGKVLCWGDNNLGQLGDGQTVDASFAPIEVHAAK